ncbi:MAG: hypothetical protein AB8I08_32980 [Sandaracinaceae bacterium]
MSGDWRYRLSKDDLLWAARMVEGETLSRRAGKEADARAVLWTMTQLFSPEGQRAKYGRERFASFTGLIRAYSQPINPRWTEAGEFCRPGGRFHGQDECSDNRLRARAQLQQASWSGIDPALRREVVLWATGRSVNNVPKAIEFAADRVARSFIERNAGARQVARFHNTFVATSGSLGWLALPQVEGQVRAGVSGGLVVAAVVAVGGFAGWAAMRSFASD